LVHRTSTDPQYREMSQRLVTPAVAGRKIAGKDVYGINCDPTETDESGMAAGIGRMKDLWVEDLNAGAGGYVGDIAGGDIAVGTGTLYHGNQIPLPYFSDGTQATQAQCRWIVSGYWWRSGGDGSTWQWFYSAAYADANRVVHCYGQLQLHGYYYGYANYMIIGARA